MVICSIFYLKLNKEPLSHEKNCRKEDYTFQLNNKSFISHPDTNLDKKKNSNKADGFSGFVSNQKTVQIHQNNTKTIQPHKFRKQRLLNFSKNSTYHGKLVGNFGKPQKRNILEGRKIRLENIEILNQLKYFAYYASLAYCLNEKNGKIAPGIYAKTILKKEEIILYIRGIELSVREWQERRTSFVYYLSDENSRVDSEFYNQFHQEHQPGSLSGANLIRNLVSKAGITEVQNINIVAHGVGGVYAIFAALDLNRRWPHLNIDVYTYGQPRIGNKFFARFVESNDKIYVYRVTHSNDYITQMPLIKFKGFLHHNMEYWIALACPCENPVVYKCFGNTVDDGFFEENQWCNAQYNEIVDFSHKGPYFESVMGICPTQEPPWLSELETVKEGRFDKNLE
ncbi:hypothetical protein G9A89_020244 [Geosiphon pyriformis]|nr:hypothetical protein G9A89_020244 [Geosiphon pyriformis]